MEALKKFSLQPGLCDEKELDEVKAFFIEYIKLRDIYLSAYANDPVGSVLDYNLKKADWYQKRTIK